MSGGSSGGGGGNTGGSSFVKRFLLASLGQPYGPMQDPILNDHLLAARQGRGSIPLDRHFDAGAEEWPVVPPAVAMHGRHVHQILPGCWLIHYDSLAHPGATTPSYWLEVGAASVWHALGDFLKRGITTTSLTKGVLGTTTAVPGGTWIGNDRMTHIVAVQPIGSPYLRVLLPSNLFVTRDQDGRQVIPYPY